MATPHRNAYLATPAGALAGRNGRRSPQRAVFSKLSLVRLAILFERPFVIFKISRKVRDKNLSGGLRAVSTNSIPGPAFARHRAWRRVPYYLLFAAFGAITTTTVGA